MQPLRNQEELENALEVLSENLFNQLTPVLDYFEEFYVGGIQRNNRRRRPTFKPETGHAMLES